MWSILYVDLAWYDGIPSNQLAPSTLLPYHHGLSLAICLVERPAHPSEISFSSERVDSVPFLRLPLHLTCSWDLPSSVLRWTKAIFEMMPQIALYPTMVLGFLIALLLLLTQAFPQLAGKILTPFDHSRPPPPSPAGQGSRFKPGPDSSQRKSYEH